MPVSTLNEIYLLSRVLSKSSFLHLGITRSFEVTAVSSCAWNIILITITSSILNERCLFVSSVIEDCFFLFIFVYHQVSRCFDVTTVVLHPEGGWNLICTISLFFSRRNIIRLECYQYLQVSWMWLLILNIFGVVAPARFVSIYGGGGWLTSDVRGVIGLPSWLMSRSVYPDYSLPGQFVSWEPEGRYYSCTKYMVIAPFWLSTDEFLTVQVLVLISVFVRLFW